MDIEVKELASTLKATRIIGNLFEIKSHNMLVYIKISNINPVFFGLTKRLVEKVINHQGNSVVVLLTGKSSGWIYTKNDVRQKINSHQWALGNVGVNADQYKIVGNALDERNYYSTLESLKSRIV